MGWDFTLGATRAQIIRERTIAQANEKYLFSCDQYKIVRNHLWSIQTLVDRETSESETYLCLDLLRKERGYGWGYKSITEAMGPLYYDCPLSLLDIVPIVNQGWRNKVIEYHRRDKRPIAIGDRVILEGCVIPSATIIQTRPILGVYGGTTYALNKQIIQEVIHSV
jgi:hypothetical protein